MKKFTFENVELKIGDQVIRPIRSIDYRNSPISWSGTKRKRCPYWLWHFVMSSRAMNWPVVHRVLRWLVNKTDKWAKVHSSSGVIGRCRRIAGNRD